jgi:hypothetical protein
MFNSLKQWFKILALLVALVACGLQEPAPTTEETVDPKAVATNGLTGVYYDNMDFTGITKTQVDATINKSWAKAAPITGIAATTYSVRWTGQIMPAFSQTYTFYLTSSDGARLMVNGQVVVNDWVDGASRVRSGTVALVANTKYDIRLEYYRNATNASTVKLEWQSASRARQVVPIGNLFPTLSNAQNVITALNTNSKFTALGIILDSSTSRVKLNTDGSLDSVMQTSTGNGFMISKTNSGNVLSLQYFSKVGNLGSLTDVLSSRSVSIDSLSSYINSDGTATDAQRQALAIKLVDFFSEGRVSVSATTVSVTQGIDSRRSPRWLEYVPGLCKIFLPPLDCANHSCIKLAEGYRDAVCGVAFAGSEMIIGLLSGLVVGPAQIAAKIFTATLGGAAPIDLIARIMSLQPAWNAYLDCISGKVPVLMPDGVTISRGCPPILEGANPVGKTDIVGHSGTVSVSFNSSTSSQSPLTYSWNFVRDSPTFGFSPPSSFPGSVSGNLTPGQGLTINLDYRCDKVEVMQAHFVINHNAGNVSSPLQVPVTINCIAPTPKLSANSLTLATKVNTSVSGDILLRNVGDADLKVSSITGVTTTSALTGAKLEISSNPAPVPITPNAGWNVGIKGTCGDVSGKLSGYITVSSNEITNPVAQVPVSLQCTEDIKLSGPPSAKFVSSALSWSGLGKTSISIQNTSRIPVAYTATLNSMPRVNIVGGATGTIAANGSIQINLEASCGEASFSSLLDGTLNILVDGIVKTSIPVRHICVPVVFAATVTVDGLDCGVLANVLTYQVVPDWFILGGPGYGRQIILSDPCVIPNQVATAFTKGQADADAHLFVTEVEQWELPCSFAKANGGGPAACRRETWTHAKARFDTLTNYIR